MKKTILIIAFIIATINFSHAFTASVEGIYIEGDLVEIQGEMYAVSNVKGSIERGQFVVVLITIEKNEIIDMEITHLITFINHKE